MWDKAAYSRGSLELGAFPCNDLQLSTVVLSNLEVTHGRILSPSSTDATRCWWNVYGSCQKKLSICPWVASWLDGDERVLPDLSYSNACRAPSNMRSHAARMVVPGSQAWAYCRRLRRGGPMRSWPRGLHCRLSNESAAVKQADCPTTSIPVFGDVQSSRVNTL